MNVTNGVNVTFKRIVCKPLSPRKDVVLKKNIMKNLVFFSLIRTLASPKVGCISEIKININLFCISLNLHYLCRLNYYK